MALQIGKVNSRVEVQEEQKTAEAAASAVGVRLNMSDSELMEKIRPIVTQILQEELSRFKRWQG
jgi:hypothetical protein